MASYTTSEIVIHGAVILISRIDGHWEGDLGQLGFSIQRMRESLYHKSVPVFSIHGMNKFAISYSTECGDRSKTRPRTQTGDCRCRVRDIEVGVKPPCAP